jgi:membrane dipeptidase
MFLLVGCSEDALEIHEKILTIDTHVDTPLFIYYQDLDLGEYHNPHEVNRKVDFPRMEEGGLDVIFFAFWVAQGPRTPEGNEDARQLFLNIYNATDDQLQFHTERAEIALSPGDAFSLETEGKRAIFFGMENGYPIGTDLALVNTYYDLGIRYITLCHTKNNDICDSSTDSNGPEHNGLSGFGIQVVQEMNRLGMMVDVSHISDEAFYDVLEITTAPVIASHSNTRSVYDHPRNMSDAMLNALAENGGVIQVPLLYVKAPDPENPPTVSDVVDHIDHIVQMAGIDHVGIGTDFDGGGEVEDCFDVSEIGNFTVELVIRGYSEEQIRKIWGGNLMRVFSEVEQAAE